MNICRNWLIAPKNLRSSAVGNHEQKDHNVGGTIGLTGHVFGAEASGGISFPGNVRPNIGSVESYLQRSSAGDWLGFMVIGPHCIVSGKHCADNWPARLAQPMVRSASKGFHSMTA